MSCRLGFPGSRLRCILTCKRYIGVQSYHTWKVWKGREEQEWAEAAAKLWCTPKGCLSQPWGALQKRWLFRAVLIWGERAWLLEWSVSGYRLPWEGEWLCMRQLSSPETICDVAASWALSIWGSKSFTLQGASGWCVTALTTDHPLFHSYSFLLTFLGVAPSGVPVDLSSWEKLRRGSLVPQTLAPVAVVGLGVPPESSLLCSNIDSRFLLPLASASCDSVVLALCGGVTQALIPGGLSSWLSRPFTVKIG